LKLSRPIPELVNIVRTRTGNTVHDEPTIRKRSIYSKESILLSKGFDQYRTRMTLRFNFISSSNHNIHLRLIAKKAFEATILIKCVIYKKKEQK
jgi:hypothetical protein